jgi:hypothetical protein
MYTTASFISTATATATAAFCSSAFYLLSTALVIGIEMELSLIRQRRDTQEQTQPRCSPRDHD